MCSSDLKWTADKMAWTQSSKDAHSNKLVYQVNDLEPDHFYTILINGKMLARKKTDGHGSLKFDFKTSANSDEIALNK